MHSCFIGTGVTLSKDVHFLYIYTADLNHVQRHVIYSIVCVFAQYFFVVCETIWLSLHATTLTGSLLLVRDET